MHTTPMTLNRAEQLFLGGTARQAVERGLAGEPAGNPPAPPTSAKVLFQKAGAFVTFHHRGRLRGCIGSMIGRDPLYLTVSRMAWAAAFEDPRFPPLRSEEWPETETEISVLGPLCPCPDPSQIEIGRHGLLLRRGAYSGVFLPQVPVEQGWDLSTYLTMLCGKAGLPDGSWRDPDAELYRYEAFVFTPPTPDGGEKTLC